jgi:hypothetical protein
MITRAYITCTVGVEKIGYMLMSRGFTDFLTSLLQGLLGHVIHRLVWLGVAYVLVTGIYIVLLFVWDSLNSTTAEVAVLFIVSIAAGACNSINVSQFSGETV